MKTTQLDRIEAKLDLLGLAIIAILLDDKASAQHAFNTYKDTFDDQIQSNINDVLQTVEIEKEEQNGVDEN